MPNKNQKNKPNGFVIYANEIRNELLREGHVIRNMPDLIAAASPKWQNLPADEREYYKDRAKWEWENSRNSNAAQYMKKPVRPNRKDCTGANLDDRVDVVQINQEKRRRERTEVFMSWPQEEGMAVTERSFYFVSFICLLEEPAFIQPLEVAAVEFSVLHGITRSWHRHINPGKIQVGYQYLAQQISESTHLIPIEGIAEPVDSYTSIYDEFLFFISRGSNHIPPIHVKVSECDRVERCIKELAKLAGRPHQVKRIYELEGLVLDLDFRLKGQPQDFLQSKQKVTDIISSTLFDWDSESKCEYHQENETKFCAKGYVYRYSYCISAYFCHAFEIKMTEGHEPTRKTDEKFYTLINNPSERNKQRDSNKSREEIEREGMARKVAEQLSQLKMAEESGAADEIERREQDEHKRLEQKKRWLSLRGAEGGQTTTVGRESSQTSIQPNQAARPAFGRGRGRGASNILHSLRRPGDHPGATSAEKPNYPPLGRGTKMHTGN